MVLSKSLTMQNDAVIRCVTAASKMLSDFEAMRKLPPATDAQIASLAASVKQPLPSDLISWLSAVNGHNHAFCLASGWSFLSTVEIAMHWGFFADVSAGIAPSFERTDHPHRVKIPANYKLRIPIAADYAGNLLVIDNDPVATEYAGQILFVLRADISETFVVFNTFIEMLDSISTKIENSDILFRDGDLAFVNNHGCLLPFYELGRPFRLPRWQPRATDESFVASLSPAQRSACYLGQNDLLQTEMFSASDIDLVRSIVVDSGLLETADWLAGFPFLSIIRINGNATSAAFHVLAQLPIVSLTVAATTNEGYAGSEVLAASRTLQVATLFKAEQDVFEVLTSIPTLRRINDLRTIDRLPRLQFLTVHGSGTPDVGPAYVHPTLADFSLSWRPALPRT
jgi:cell wall assembly regulator SMI1